MSNKIDFLQDPLDPRILRGLARGEMQGGEIVDRPGRLSKNTLKLTRAGRRQLEAERRSWNHLSAIIAEVTQKA